MNNENFIKKIIYEEIISSENFINLMSFSEPEKKEETIRKIKNNEYPLLKGMRLAGVANDKVIIECEIINNNNENEKYEIKPALNFAATKDHCKRNRIEFENLIAILLEQNKIKLIKKNEGPNEALIKLQEYAKNGLCINYYKSKFKTKQEFVFAKNVKIILHICLRSYPYGGGEDFIKEACRQFDKENNLNIWLTFRNKNYEIYKKLEVKDEGSHIKIDFPMVDTDVLAEEIIVRLTSIFGVDIINAQGELNEVVERVSAKLRVPSIVGYHYWNGLIELKNNNNIEIIKNIKQHSLNRTYNARKNLLVHRYIVSDFMREVLSYFTETNDIKVINPVPTIDKYKWSTSRNQLTSKQIILQLNCSILKGGEVFYHLSKNNKNKEFIYKGYCATEKEFKELCEYLKETPQELNRLGIQYEYIEDITYLFKKTLMLLVPTKVDETYSKVVHEAVAAGIPVLTSGKGNIQNILKNSIEYVEPENIKEWSKIVNYLINDKNKLEQISKEQRKIVKLENNNGITLLEKLLETASKKITKKNLALFLPWADQGLGIQGRIYAKILKEHGFQVHIFSFQSYLSVDRSLQFQANGLEWDSPKYFDTIYYSLNNREEVTNYEVNQFIKINNIGKFVMPEICWDINWKRLLNLNHPNLMLYVIPNIETVRKSEVNNHNKMYKTLANTKFCHETLSESGVNNIEYIGHGFGEINSLDLQEKLKFIKNNKTINFIHIGGYDSVERKNTLKVVEAFLMLCKFREDINLTIAIQDRIPIDLFKLINESNSIGKIKLLLGNKNFSEIMSMYKTAHLSIQPSSHEGLGLNFYEAISNLVPVITLDVAPHNEIVVSDVTGSLIKANLKTLKDNDDSYCMYADFNVIDLVVAMNHFNQKEIIDILPKLMKYYNNTYSEKVFSKRFIDAII